MSADIASVTIDKLRRENEEQAQLLAGVAEREARLLARIGALQEDRERLDWMLLEPFFQVPDVKWAADLYRKESNDPEEYLVAMRCALDILRKKTQP